MADYGFIHGGKVFTPNGSTVAPEDNDARNAAILAAELASWATQPDSIVVYYHFPAESGPRPYRTDFVPLRADATVTLWTGEMLGTITRARVYLNNFGARMVSLRVKGNNGARYYGRASWDNGECIRLRKVKS